MNELLTLSLTDLTTRLAERKSSPIELMEAVLDRIEETHDDLNALVAQHPREKLLAAARDAETRIGRGEARALEGIPLGVKDLEDAAWSGHLLRLPACSRTTHLRRHDSTQVARLRSGGRHS